MTLDQLKQMCEELGIKINVDPEVINGVKGYCKNYNQVEKAGETWIYSEVNFESRPAPEKENIVTFDNETEAIKYFFLKTLRNFYSNKIHTPNNPVRKFRTVQEMENLFKNLGIKEEFYSFSVKRPQEVYGEIEGDMVRVSYLDANTQRKFAMMPMNLDRDFFAMYRLTYSLSMLKDVENEFLQKGVLRERFDDHDIELFIK